MATSQEMQENMNYIVWSIQPRHDRFDEIVQRMKSYAMEMLQPKNAIVNFVFDDHLHQVKLTQEKRKELFLIFKEAIHNITKYANCSTVTILFSKHENKIVMEISDDGIGFDDKEVFTGNGLHTMRERARTLKGDLKISSGLETGTIVALSFPAK
jgi:signal transduction histidine kinase